VPRSPQRPGRLSRPRRSLRHRRDHRQRGTAHPSRPAARRSHPGRPTGQAVLRTTTAPSGDAPTARSPGPRPQSPGWHRQKIFAAWTACGGSQAADPAWHAVGRGLAGAAGSGVGPGPAAGIPAALADLRAVRRVRSLPA